MALAPSDQAPSRLELEQCSLIRELKSTSRCRSYVVRLKHNNQLLVTKELVSIYSISTPSLSSTINTNKFNISPEEHINHILDEFEKTRSLCVDNSLFFLCPPVAISLKSSILFYLFAENLSVADHLLELNSTQQMIILYGVINGLKILHQKNMLHLNLKPENVLLDSKNWPHLCGFGFVEFHQFGNMKECGYKYAAPEVWKRTENGSQIGEINDRTDIYAYAMLFLEILTRKTICFDQKGLNFNFLVENEKNKEKMEHVLKMKNILNSCLNECPSDRPTATDLVNLFDNGTIMLTDCDFLVFHEYYLKSKKYNNRKSSNNNNNNNDLNNNSNNDNNNGNNNAINGKKRNIVRPKLSKRYSNLLINPNDNDKPILPHHEMTKLSPHFNPEKLPPLENNSESNLENNENNENSNENNKGNNEQASSVKNKSKIKSKTGKKKNSSSSSSNNNESTSSKSNKSNSNKGNSSVNIINNNVKNSDNSNSDNTKNNYNNNNDNNNNSVIDANINDSASSKSSKSNKSTKSTKSTKSSKSNKSNKSYKIGNNLSDIPKKSIKMKQNKSSNARSIAASFFTPHQETPLELLIEKANPDDPQSEYALAEAYMEVRDFPNSARHYKIAAKHGHVDGMYKFGLILLEGKGIEMNCAKAAFYLRHAGLQGNTQSEFIYSKMLLDGEDYKYNSNYNSSLNCNFSNFYNNNNNNNYYNNNNYSNKSPNKGSNNGCGGIKQNIEKGLLHLRHAAGKHNYDALLFYGEILENGKYELQADPAQALKAFIRAAEGGNVEAMFHCGRMFLHGKGTNKKYSKAVYYTKMAADLKHPGALAVYGYLLENGIGTPKNVPEALKIYKKGAKMNEPYSMNSLGRLIFEKDAEKAAELFAKAAELGSAPAMNNYARLLETGKGGVEMDIGEAVRLYERAVEMGDPVAMVNLGQILEKGYIIDEDCQINKIYQTDNKTNTNSNKSNNNDKMKDDKYNDDDYNDISDKFNNKDKRNKSNFSNDKKHKQVFIKDTNRAAELYKRAAVELSDATGQLHYARCLEVGLGAIKKNQKESFLMYRLAAKGGNVKAMFAAARMLENGEGCKSDIPEALRFYTCAANNGYRPAVEAIERFKKKK